MVLCSPQPEPGESRRQSVGMYGLNVHLKVLGDPVGVEAVTASRRSPRVPLWGSCWPVEQGVPSTQDTYCTLATDLQMVRGP